jgi:hypothetical protein
VNNVNRHSDITLANVWWYTVGRYNGTSLIISLDDVKNLASAAANLSWPSKQFYIGARNDNGAVFQGVIDELRVSRVARSDSYVKTSFNNMNMPFTFYSVGSEEQAQGKPIIGSEDPLNHEGNVSVNTTALSFLLFDLQGDLMSYTVTSAPNIGSASGANVPDGVYTVPISGLNKSSVYMWYVNATDGSEWAYKTYTFTTEMAPAVNNTNSTNTTNTTVSLLVDSTFDASVDSADLRANSAGQDWYESRLQNQSRVTLDETNVSGNAGKKAKFVGGTSSSKDNVYLSQEFSTPQTGSFSVEWRVNVDEIYNRTPYQSRSAFMMIGDDADGAGGPNTYSASSPERFAYLLFDKTGGGSDGTMKLMYNNASGYSTFLKTLNMDQWYTIKVDLDVVADTYKVYVDGVSVSGNIPAATPKTNLTHISFATWSDGPGTFYIDDVKALG